MALTGVSFHRIDYILNQTTSFSVQQPNPTNIQYRPSAYPGILDTDLTTLTTEQRLGFTITTSFLFMLSLCGNVGTLYVNLRRKMRAFFRACLISLALSDLLSTIFLVTAYLAQFTATYVQIWRLGTFMCKFVPFITTAAILTSSLTLIGIALDRYFAVLKVKVTFWNPGVSFSMMFVFGIWITSLGVALPVFYIYHTLSVYILSNENTSKVDSSTTSWQANASKENLSYTAVKPLKLVTMCLSDQKDVALYYVIVFSIIFMPCILSFIWLNGVIAKKIWIRRHRTLHRRKTKSNQAKLQLQKIPDNSLETSKSISKSTSYAKSFGNGSRQQNTREARHIRMFIVIVLLMAVFIFLRLPAWIFLVMRMFGSFSEPKHWIIYFSFGILNITSCALNPLFYTFLPETIQYILCCQTKFGCNKNENVEDVMMQKSEVDIKNCKELNQLENNDDEDVDVPCCICCGLLCRFPCVSKCTTKQTSCNSCKNTKSGTLSIDEQDDEGVDCNDSNYDEDDSEVNNQQEICIVFSSNLVKSFNQQIE